MTAGYKKTDAGILLTVSETTVAVDKSAVALGTGISVGHEARKLVFAPPGSTEQLVVVARAEK